MKSRGTLRRSAIGAIAVAATWCFPGCAGWTPVHSTAEWKLFVRDGAPVDVARFERVLEPAFDAVEQRMGPFHGQVPVHAWQAEDTDVAAGREFLPGAAPDGTRQVPGIGPARVRAFHVRGGTSLFAQSGIFLGGGEVGTAVHELVHARLAEEKHEVPLWFEEGLASLFGDGALFEGRWVVDGLAYWPMRELRNQQVEDAELTRLLQISARDSYDARENLMVHFVGWAIVFDLYREQPQADWRTWLAAFREGAAARGNLQEARRRLDHTLAWDTHREWLERLHDPNPGVRIAAAKGVWKLRSLSAVDALLDALETEQHPEVRFALAVNAMLTTGEMRLGRERWWRMREHVFPTIRENELADPEEREAGRELYDSMRRWGSDRRGRAQQAIQELSRFWEE